MQIVYYSILCIDFFPFEKNVTYLQCVLPSQQGPMISAGYHWVSLRSIPLRWQWLGGYWGRSPEGAACLWKLMMESIHDTHKAIILCAYRYRWERWVG